ncbi:MAG: peptidylprolyl isomerase [Gammaproteobacteria bacterium]|nr:peptidylprolyl isomerase [Gammaproteobacteria bacterium]MDH3535223.1 peptidylprolyl isomerase [Gammaproteobacteria bacterium]
MGKVILGMILLVDAMTIIVHAGQLSDSDIAIRVDDLIINASEFEVIFRSAVRQKYYHGRVPAEELQQFKQQVAQDIVTQVIVHREAERQGLQPDRATIAGEIEAYDAKYRNRPEWLAQRESVLPQLALRMERQNLLEQMEARIRQLPKPGNDQVVAFYDSNPDKFTEPARSWGSVILLPVPPSAGEAAWSEAETRALQLKFRIENGEDFAPLAQQHSGHPSAVNGGDLGYLHRGVLEQSVQQRVDALEIDEISDPIRVLEGILLFRLNGVQPPQLKPFAEVQQRAAGLLNRELQDQAWENYLRELKASADIYVNENLYIQSNHE